MTDKDQGDLGLYNNLFADMIHAADKRKERHIEIDLDKLQIEQIEGSNGERFQVKQDGQVLGNMSEEWADRFKIVIHDEHFKKGIRQLIKEQRFALEYDQLLEEFERYLLKQDYKK